MQGLVFFLCNDPQSCVPGAEFIHHPKHRVVVKEQADQMSLSELVFIFVLICSAAGILSWLVFQFFLKRGKKNSRKKVK